MKLSRSVLREFILNEVDDLFADDDDESNDIKIADNSLDDQIDSFLLKFENDSIVDDEKIDFISKSLSEMSLKTFLVEQPDPTEDEDEEAPEDTEPPEDIAEPDDKEESEIEEPAGSEDVEVNVPSAPPKLPIDIDAFAKRVARLAMNADKLLDIKSVIINRALSFLADNYDNNHVEEMKEVIPKFLPEIGPSADLDAPFAAGAYAGGTGQMGGGG